MRAGCHAGRTRCGRRRRCRADARPTTPMDFRIAVNSAWPAMPAPRDSSPPAARSKISTAQPCRTSMLPMKSPPTEPPAMTALRWRAADIGSAPRPDTSREAASNLASEADLSTAIALRTGTASSDFFSLSVSARRETRQVFSKLLRSRQKVARITYDCDWRRFPHPGRRGLFPHPRGDALRTAEARPQASLQRTAGIDRHQRDAGSRSAGPPHRRRLHRTRGPSRLPRGAGVFDRSLGHRPKPPAAGIRSAAPVDQARRRSLGSPAHDRASSAGPDGPRARRSADRRRRTMGDRATRPSTKH